MERRGRRLRTLVVGALVAALCACASRPLSHPIKGRTWIDGEEVSPEQFSGTIVGVKPGELGGSLIDVVGNGELSNSQQVIEVIGSTTVHCPPEPDYLDCLSLAREVVGRGGNSIAGVIYEHPKSGRWVASEVTIRLTAEQAEAISKPIREKNERLRSEREEEKRQADAKAAAAEAARQEKIAAWRNTNPKPPLPEEVNRNRVLAEDAVQEKHFEDAARYYEAGLRQDPFWPEGQYNAAVINGELKNYALAAAHMHWYLDLVPDAKDADLAQNKIIVWEEKARQLGQPLQVPGSARSARHSKQ